MLCMPMSLRRTERSFWLCVLLWVAAACNSVRPPTVEAAETLAELRLVKGSAQLAEDNQTRTPHPKERLAAGQSVVLEAGGLVWMRKDGGATWLVAGPAEFQLQPDTITVKRGRFFVDTEHGEPESLITPRGPLALGSARASVDVDSDGTVYAYVLRGEASFEHGRLSPGQELTWRSEAKPMVKAAVTWTDWTGGLAVADSVAAPAPFGIGTVGARRPNEAGAPRFPLLIARLDVNVTIDGDFAVTEVDQTFVNPTTSTVEGLFSFRTPTGAILQRFGVDRDKGLVWGRIKESIAAETQYKSNVYEGSTEEPALLEWQGDGAYSARLYPIASRSRRRVVTRYGEWLPRNGQSGERRLYVYPMAAHGAKGSLPLIEELSVTIDLTNAGATSVRPCAGAKHLGQQVIYRAADVVPEADLSLELFDTGSAGAVAYRAPHNLLPQDNPEGMDQGYAAQISKEEANYVAIPIRVPRHVAPEPGPDTKTSPDASGVDLAIVVDTSAATEPSALALARSLAGSLLSHLGPGDRAALWTGDAVLHPVTATAGELTPVSPQSLEAWLAGLAGAERGGATDLGALVQSAASKLDPQRRGAVVYIGDGAPSVGELVPKTLAERLARLPTGTRIFAAALGSDPNLPVLEAVTRGGGVYQVQDGHGAGAAALAILSQAQRFTWLDAKLDLGPGVERVFPRVLPPLVEDGTIVVVGRVVGALPAKVTLTGTGGNLELPLTERQLDDSGDLRRRWGEARFDELMAAGAGRAELVDVAQRTGIVSPVTSLYVSTRREEAQEAKSEVDQEQEYADQVAKERRWQPWRRGGVASDVAGAFFDLRKAGPVVAMAPGKPQETAAAAPADNKEGGSGTRYATRAKGEEGSMGQASAPAMPPEEADRLMKQTSQRSESGGIGLGSTGKLGSPSNHWSRDSSASEDQGMPLMALGARPKAARRAKAASGSNFDPLNGDLDFGSSSGLGLSGVGAGGYGAGSGRLGGSHATSGPKLKLGRVVVSGRLPQSVVQRVIRQSFGMFRMCYAQGLSSDASLAGSVGVQFTINADGSIGALNASQGTNLPNITVIQCIVSAFAGLSFPAPEGGPAKVGCVVALGDAAPSSTPELSPSLAPALGAVGHHRLPCGAGADLPFGERLGLWRERLASNHTVSATVQVYSQALHECEAPSFQERASLLVLLVNNMSSVRDRVSLWRHFLEVSPRAADVIYRSLLLRVQSPQDLKELHEALGFRQVEPEILAKLLGQAKDPAHAVRLLRGVTEQFPDDTELALQVLDAYEDAGDEAGGRAWARGLRRRADATAHVRTNVGEYYLRVANHAVTPSDKQADIDEARRAFGELVEFAPNDPLARRQLGDLLRAHGWFEEAQRQYETLLALTPDDPVVPLLLASTAAGTGKTQEAITWLEKATASTSTDASNPLFVASQALASQYLARARLELTKPDANSPDATTTLERLRLRAQRWLTTEASEVRVVVTWSHPELHTSLWTNRGGTWLLADNHDLLGVAQGYAPQGSAEFELRLDPRDANRAARLGLRATLTAIVNEGQSDEKIASVEVAFDKREGQVRETLMYRWNDGSLVEGSR